ncbi:DUF1330 domain-containing protein [Acidobacteria bacterium AB60]|nr:DUF1330 domain-containing protein [Acidobacteria bacterium AB60]
MRTLAIAELRDIKLGPSIVEYLTRIEETLKPFGGRYLVHGSAIETLEGSWSGDLVIIEFPDGHKARGWYNSAAYQAIRPLRTDNSQGDVILVNTVPPGHRALDVLS